MHIISLVLGPPVYIVGAGLGAGQSRDERLHVPPEVHLLQEGVHPPVDDAVTPVELFLVVAVVLFVAEDEPGLLQQLHHGMGLRVHHVRPLVNLVGEDAQHHAEDDSPLVQLPQRPLRCNQQPDAYEQWHGVARAGVGFDEAMPGDVLRINMVHPEGPDQRGADDGRGELAPGVAGPVQHARYEVDQELRDDEASHNADRVLVIVRDGVVDQLRPQAQGEHHEAQLEHEFACRVVVLPEDLPVRLNFYFAHLGYQNINNWQSNHYLTEIPQPQAWPLTYFGKTIARLTSSISLELQVEMVQEAFNSASGIINFIQILAIGLVRR